MKLLKTIRDADLGLKHKEGGAYEKRTAVRAIVFDEENKIALMHVAKYDYHKLPGGGMKEGERIPDALRREILEETGCEIEVFGEVGKIIEFRDNIRQEQESLCYLGKLIGEKGALNLTKKETDHGFSLLWVDLDDAIEMLDNDNPENYSGKFIRIRDLVLLNEAKKIIEEKPDFIA